MQDLEEYGLTALGTAPVQPGDPVPEGTRSIVLLGPDGSRFWQIFRASPEFQDGLPDPLDRWSTRVIGAIAANVGAVPLFPFGGPPYLPFIDWALRSGRCHVSPVGLLVHVSHGLMVSFRGALAFESAAALSAPPASPCDSCPRPCVDACPVAALTTRGYDVPRCHDHLDSPQGTECLNGCLVRRACPVGRDHRPETQSAFHMAAFHGASR